MWDCTLTKSIVRIGALMLASLAPLAGLGGCGGGDNLPREEINGSVTIDGKPLPRGMVTFVPADAEVSTQGGASIQDGKFTIPRIQGLVPGKYKVVVSSPDDKPEEFTDKKDSNNAPGMPPVPAKEVVPSAYNTDSKLEAQVRPNAKNVFDFSLTSTSVK